MLCYYSASVQLDGGLLISYEGVSEVLNAVIGHNLTSRGQDGEESRDLVGIVQNGDYDCIVLHLIDSPRPIPELRPSLIGVRSYVEFRPDLALCTSGHFHSELGSVPRQRVYGTPDLVELVQFSPPSTEGRRVSGQRLPLLHPDGVPILLRK